MRSLALTMRKFLVLIIPVIVLACSSDDVGEEQIDVPPAQTQETMQQASLELTLDEANRLATLPLKCMQQEYPNKLGQVLGGDDQLQSPKQLHPAFYGCFDWHSSVHGHWMLVKLLKDFPALEGREDALTKLQQNLSAANIKAEIAYFGTPHNGSYERTYGWAWLLKLALELRTWDDPVGKELSLNIQPLADLIANKYLDFLPKLKYPIRVGEHTNTAFGLCFAYDYAVATENEELSSLIASRAKDFYLMDKECPMLWEPSGYDFLSPCLEEADIMRRVLSKQEYLVWLDAFLPTLSDPDFQLRQGEVSDRTDGKLVHLDGLNFSRAWCLKGIAQVDPKYAHLTQVANEHITYSLPSIVDGSYQGEHWLASFAVCAMSE